MIDSKDLLAAVLETEKWLEDWEIETKHGLRWKQAPESDKNVDLEPLMYPKSLYGGSSGIAFFLLRLYLVTKEERYLKKAQSAADEIITTYSRDDFKEASGTYAGIPTGLYNGNSGQAYFVENLYQVLKKENREDIDKYHRFILKVADNLVESQNNGTWSDTVSIIGDGGNVLFLVYVYELTHDANYLKSIEQAGDYFVSKARDAKIGKRWYAMDSVAFGLGKEGYFPNFLYGTSGNAYLLAVLYKVVGKAEYLETARQGAQYVESVAVNKSKGKLIPYNVPYRSDLYYLGMCQGPVGTSRLFKILYEITGEDHYKVYVRSLTEGILSTGAPLVHSPGYWGTYCYCCGAAGMLEHFLSADTFLDTSDYLSISIDSAKALIGDSYIDHDKRRWYTAWTRLLPKDIEVYTGLYHGSSGCANALLSLYNELNEKIELPGFLEDYWV